MKETKNRRSHHRHGGLLATAVAMAAAAAITPAARAATDTWVGLGGDGNWTTAANWDAGTGNAPPVANDVLQFAGTTNLNTTNGFTANTQFNGISFLSGAGAFALGGNAVLVGGDVTNSSANTQTITLGLVMDGVTSTVSRAGGGALSLGTMTFGLIAPNSITVPSTSVSTVNVSHSLSTGNLLARTNSATANSINLDSGQTLTVNGTITVGGYDTGNAASTPKLTISSTGGTGSLVVSAGTGNLLIGGDTGGTAGITATLDLAGLSNFTFSGGEFNLGGRQANNTGDRANGNVNLAANANTITANAVNVGAGSNNNAGGANFLRLGGGTNVINASNIFVGTHKSTGTVQFQGGTGALTVRDTAGTGRANLVVGRHASSGTASAKGNLLLNGHNVDILGGALEIGTITSSSTDGTVASVVEFDTGTVDVISVKMGQNDTARSTTTATLTVGGTGTLIIGAGPFTMGGYQTLRAGQSANAVFNVNGGTATVNTDITRGLPVGTGVTTATVNLAGGTLDMTNHALGTVAAPMTTVNLTGGVLNNPGMITAVTTNIATGVTINGTPTYVLTSGGALNSSLTTLTLASGSGIEGGGATAGTVSGNVAFASGARVDPGTSGVAGTLSFNNDLSFASGSLVKFDLSNNPLSGNDQINVVGNLTLLGTVSLTPGILGTGAAPGNTYTLINYTGTLTGNETNLAVTTPGTRTTYTVAPTATTPNQIQLSVGGTAPFALTWIGNVNNNWDVIGASNWQDPSLNAEKFYNLDTVTFDDTSTNLSDVQLVGALTPAGVTVNATRNYKFAGTGSIAGGGNLTKSGSGTLILATNNTYSGTTDINGGTLQVGDGGTTGSSGTGAINNNGALIFNRSDNVTVASAINGGGALTKNGSGTLTISNANAGFSGATTINAGALRLGNVAAAGSGAIAVNGGAALVVVPGGTVTNTLTVAGGAIGPVNGDNTFSGDFTFSPGTSTVYTVDPQALAGTTRNVILTGPVHGTGNITVINSTSVTSPDGGQGFRLRGSLASDYSGTVTLSNSVKAELQTDQASGSPAGTADFVLTAGNAALDGTTDSVTNAGGYSDLVLRNNSGGDTVLGNDVSVSGSGLAVINMLGTGAFAASLGNLTIGAAQQLGTFNGNGRTAVFQSVTLTGGNATFSPKVSGFGTPTSEAADLQLANIGESVAGSGIVMSGLKTLTLTGTHTYTGATSVNAGKLTIAGSLTTTSAANVTGGTLEVASDGSATRVLKATSVSVTGSGKIDLKDNKLITQSALGTWDGSAYTGITGLVQTGRGDGTWNGNGIVTSMTDATTGVLTTLAVASGAEVRGLGPTDTDLFMGQTINGDSTIVMYTWGGDADLNGELNGDDYFFIDSNAPANGSVFGYHQGDFDYNGTIDGDDYFVIDSNITFAQASPPFPTTPPVGGGGSSGLAVVPEPASIGLISLTATGLLCRRRKN